MNEGGDPRTVFVVHGRNHQVREAVFDLLQALGLQPLEWPDVLRLAGAAANPTRISTGKNLSSREVGRP